MPDDLSLLYCQNPDHGRRGHQNLTVCGRYGQHQHISLLYSRFCKVWFSESAGTHIFSYGVPHRRVLALSQYPAKRIRVGATARLIGVRPSTMVR